MAISFDETVVRRQVAELRSIASEMKKVAENDMQNTINNAKSNWQGGAADSFCNKYGIFKENIETEADNIDNLATSLENLADAIARAEQEAERIIDGAL